MNKYSNYARKLDIQPSQIVLAQGVKFLDNEDVKPNLCRRARPFLILKVLENGHYLALSITVKSKELTSQHLLPKEVCLGTNFMSKNSYVSCSNIYEIEDSHILQNSNAIPSKLFAQIINHTIKMWALGFNNSEQKNVDILYEMYSRNKRFTIGNVIKVPYNENYLFVYDETDKEFICLPLHHAIQEDTQDAIQVLKGKSYVNYDEKFYVPKDDKIYIERYGSPDMPIIEQVKHPEEALELSLFYIKKD